MEETPSEASQEPLDQLGSELSDEVKDIRELWTTATLSQPQLDALLCTEGSDSESSSLCQGKNGGDSDIVDWKCGDGRQGDKNVKQGLDERALVGLELQRTRTPGSDLGDEDLKSKAEKKMSSTNHLGHTPHRAYWAEQQSRLPLPLVEIMENEALEILTKALRSYEVGIGWDHFLTKQLLRSIEGLKKRRNKRLLIS